MQVALHISAVRHRVRTIFYLHTELDRHYRVMQPGQQLDCVALIGLSQPIRPVASAVSPSNPHFTRQGLRRRVRTDSWLEDYARDDPAVYPGSRPFDVFSRIDGNVRVDYFFIECARALPPSARPSRTNVPNSSQCSEQLPPPPTSTATRAKPPAALCSAACPRISGKNWNTWRNYQTATMATCSQKTSGQLPASVNWPITTGCCPGRNSFSTKGRPLDADGITRSRV